jgi:hypothetical protein
MDSRAKDILDEALDAWRANADDEALSGAARTALFDSVRASDGADQAPFLSGLTRAWRWVFLGSVPVVALSAVLFIAGDHRPATGSRLAASKIDGQVVFTLANGRAEHLVYRSTDPQTLNRAAAVRMAQNRYSENATGGPTLVFYRID